MNPLTSLVGSVRGFIAGKKTYGLIAGVLTYLLICGINGTEPNMEGLVVALSAMGLTIKAGQARKAKS